MRDLCRLDKVGIETIRQLIYPSSDLVERDGLFAPIALVDPHDHVGWWVVEVVRSTKKSVVGGRARYLICRPSAPLI